MPGLASRPGAVGSRARLQEAWQGLVQSDSGQCTAIAHTCIDADPVRRHHGPDRGRVAMDDGEGQAMIARQEILPDIHQRVTSLFLQCHPRFNARMDEEITPTDMVEGQRRQKIQMAFRHSGARRAQGHLLWR